MNRLQPGMGEMLSAMGNVAGSGTYVAIEKVTGSLDGKKGDLLYRYESHQLERRSLTAANQRHSGYKLATMTNQTAYVTHKS